MRLGAKDLRNGAFMFYTSLAHVHQGSNIPYKLELSVLIIYTSPPFPTTSDSQPWFLCLWVHFQCECVSGGKKLGLHGNVITMHVYLNFVVRHR